MLNYIWWLPTRIWNACVGNTFCKLTYKRSSEYMRREEEKMRNIQRSIDYEMKKFMKKDIDNS